MEKILTLIDAEISRLEQARAILSGIEKIKARPAQVAQSPYNLSPEGRARIAAAVKARWARQKKHQRAS